ncbi:TonB-dependent receptor domain-containing protein [Salinimicrobium marinum]|nr:TonB-dependent receptor [Salinimicrobium marinum]
MTFQIPRHFSGIALMFIFLFSFISIQAQNKQNTVTGKVVDEAGTPLEYATISFENTANPENITGGITDPEGVFSIDVSEGTYDITVEFISFEPKTFSGREITSDVEMGTITLGMAAGELDEVVVTAETTQVEVRLDKKIYNIGKDLTTAGGTVSDALNNVPSVSVDLEGGISLRGNENVRILINGKPSAMAGFGSTDVLAQLPADAIERVEVITSPSARYDAEGTAGILNIILKKEKTLGFNGSVTLTAGHPDNAGISANVNYRTDKFNLFNTTGFRYFDAPGNGFFDTRYNENSNVDFDRIVEDREITRLNRGYNTNLGMEYYLNDQSSITGSIFFRTGEDEDVTTNVTDNYLNTFSSSNPAYGTTRIENQMEEDNSWQFALNYINRFSESGHQLTADLQYETDKETQTTRIDETPDFNEIEYERFLFGEAIDQEETQKEWLIQADYVLPIGKDSQFEAGYRGNFENETTDYNIRQEDTLGNLVLNNRLTNIFDYTENVQALYTQYGTKFGDVSFLLGLRLENTNLKGEIESELTEAELEEEFGFPINTSFDNNYLGLFPTVNVIYELAETENITIGYNRRINRPRGWFINPFPSRSSTNNVFQGNPNLQPAFSNAFDVGYLKRWEKLTLTSSVYYQKETDAFERIEENVEGSNVVRTIPVNLSSNERTGGELGLLYNPANWLRLNGSFNYFQFKTEGEFNNRDYNAKNTSYFARFSSKVTLPGSIDWQTNAFYAGPSEGVQGTQEGLLSIDLALSKELFNETTTLSFNVRDLLNSRKRERYTTTNTYDRYSEFQWRQRSFNISLMYRFNQQKRDQRREGENGDDMGEGEF